MNNAISTLALLFFGAASINAQIYSENTIGLRLGDSDAFGAEISYQRALGQENRAEINLGWRDSREYNAFRLTGLYQWVRPIDAGFNWYYGAGAGLGSVNFESPVADDGLFILAAGNLGIEYNFDFPLTLSLDIRPEIGIIGYDDFDDAFDFDIALGIRYRL